MYYAQMRKHDIANGPGIRATLFISGCTHNCRNCFNKEYQNFKYGKAFNKAAQDEFISFAKDEHVVGISILGGEPFQQNPEEFTNFLNRLYEEVKKPIWVWTGYLYENIPMVYKEALTYIDTIIDGPFIEELKDLKLFYRGSSNQRVIDNLETLNNNKIIKKIIKEELS